MFKHKLYYDLLDALAQPECPICGLLRKAVELSIGSLLYENVNDIGTRQALSHSCGFCAKHAWQVRQHGDPLAHAILYTDQLAAVLKKGKARWPEPLNSLKSVLSSLEPADKNARCPLCALQMESEQAYLEAIAEYLSDKEFVGAFHDSYGLCRPHFQRFAQLKCGDDIKKVVCHRFLDTAQALLQELSEIKRKADYRFSHEEMGTERDAWLRSVSYWVGLPGVF